MSKTFKLEASLGAPIPESLLGVMELVASLGALMELEALTLIIMGVFQDLAMHNWGEPERAPH